MTDRKAKVLLNVYRSQAVSNADETGASTPTEKWLEGLGTTLIDVLFSSHDGELVIERHVADPETIFETARMTLDRLRLRSAVVPYQGRWCVYTPGWQARETTGNQYRYYDTREAAEMVLIHNG